MVKNNGTNDVCESESINHDTNILKRSIELFLWLIEPQMAGPLDEVDENCPYILHTHISSAHQQLF